MKYIGCLRLLFLATMAFYCGMAVANSDAFAETSFRAGFYENTFPDFFSREDVEISIKLLSEEIGNGVGIKTSVTLYSDLKTMRNDFETGRINFVVASSLILASRFDIESFSEGFRLIPTIEYPDRMLLLAFKQTGKTKLLDFRGKKIVLLKDDKLSELYLEKLSQSVFKTSYKNIFKQISPETKPNQLLLKLFFNQADITCVYYSAYKTAIELNPQLLDKLQILDHLDGMPSGAGYFHKNVPVEFREQVINLAMNLPNYPRGAQLLQVFKSDKVLRSVPFDLQSIKNLYNTYQ